ncbi:Radical SAM superfamily enzyme, MoaA/NifB/PqqE/SkfB family [Bacillus sp. 5mfcol3.1]|uniref:radical SAM protein n=1 Tax=unclassified Bacillus (in: firmicutes) TaxID=185979 RepID=UPI0004792CDD|nr:MULTISPECIES: radical SAM protein [unclassified Bacillus (in: firmicutes)]SFM34452.1 Radical SAM superfamily enzyme, MoaA/NifB/PqqE/SkfB family [Bacillus sp. 5mfcol3.1]
MFNPTSLAIVSTYKCTASCQECCFECSPKLTKRISFNDIKSFIDQASVIETVKYIVWSGGECFLLGKDLENGIAYGKSKGLNSRCVTNGFWANSIEIAKNKLIRLQKKGLKELNLSTGDDHQVYVSIDNILNAAIAAVQLNITVAIAVETTANSRFSKKDILTHPKYVQYIANSDFEKYITIMNTVWMSFHEDRVFEYPDIMEFTNNLSGCDSIFDAIVITPDKSIVSCCGLTMEHIPEMHMGIMDENNLLNLYKSQFNDFLKIWIYVDGAEGILKKVQEWDCGIKYPRFVHMCQACAYMYHTPEVQKVIFENYESIFSEIMEKYKAKVLLRESSVSMV